MFALVVYVPESHAEELKSALFSKGAGRYANYDCCAWQVAGTGQFRPLDGSNPFIGNHGEIENVPELRIEMIVADEFIDAVIEELKSVHPYEEPAYTVTRVNNHTCKTNLMPSGWRSFTVD